MSVAAAAPLLMRARLLLLAAGGLALVTGVWLGLSRMGLLAPVPGRATVLAHGPLMVSGFLGTVIALERAVALRRTWGYLAPLLNGAGTVLTLTSTSLAGPVLLTLGSAVVLIILLQVIAMDRAIHHWVLASAALSWVLGNAMLVAGAPTFRAVGFWLAFLVLTIAAERLELNRLLQPTRGARIAFVLAALVLFGGAAGSALAPDLGFRLLGGGCLGLAAWLLTHDVARRTVKQRGPVRYIAVALLAGYAWLALAGALAVWRGHPVAGPLYDALLHAVFVGFVFSMIFGHALVIIPAVLGVGIEYRPRFYAHLALLHGSLLLRVAGDLSGSPSARSAGAWLNAAAIALFIVSTVAAVRRRRPGQAPARAPSPAIGR